MNIQQTLFLDKETEHKYQLFLAQGKDYLTTALKTLIDTEPLFKLNPKIDENIIESLMQYENVIFIGIGGSSLGGQALYALKQTLEKDITNSTPNIIFVDNVDPFTINMLIKHHNFNNTAIVAVSKSGNTIETIANIVTLTNELPKPYKHHMFFVTEKDNNAMRELANLWNLTVLEHPKDIGGRFSVFSIVGMMPALLSNLKWQDFISGANFALDNLLTACVESAIAQYVSEKSQTVIMPYCDALNVFAKWFQQLWAESLGKKNHQSITCGTTPVAAIGTTDQHSQLQLYLDGPKDKFFNIITLEQHPDIKFNIPQNLKHPVFQSLNGKNMHQLLNAEAKATTTSLKNHNCPIKNLHVKKLDEEHLGALIMYSIMETLASAILMAVNPFNQPAVEEGKILAMNFLQEFNN